ncbi:MAG: DJ-1/PfpI family protein [Candidatus Peregrinibacteria bacterium]|nr:DJ-1/PfpI family protein [Candidatus Peregrinibacteria bacterium]MDZ4244974.1 DJ-1/PfpI family protein [Candidatus Gracilibacteria bacterium]
MAKILMVIGYDGFRDEEYFEPKVILEAAGHEVITTSKEKIAVSSVEKKEVHVDMLFDELFKENAKPEEEFDVIAFIGGAGAETYLNDKNAHKLSWDFYNNSKLVAAICLAPVILANAGLLVGKAATVWSGAKPQLCAGHCLYQSSGVITDGRIITASGPDKATEFGEAILAKLQK